MGWYLEPTVSTGEDVYRIWQQMRGLGSDFLTPPPFMDWPPGEGRGIPLYPHRPELFATPVGD
jgi:hypothetical protein